MHTNCNIEKIVRIACIYRPKEDQVPDKRRTWQAERRRVVTVGRKSEKNSENV